MQIESLVRMASQIGDFLDAHGPGDSSSRVAEAITSHRSVLQ